ncbi:MAG: protein kinase [Gemmatimonadetes bacterium]|nr:protein kinase [Gemmatimonadota bacterium]
MTSSHSELLARLQAALGPQYRIERELGYGGMGVVFLARDTTLDRPVAVKVVHPELAVHSSITQRFLAEARMIAKLRHPSIVAVHTAGETTGIFYYVMDYVPGESLRQRLQREGKLAPDLVAHVVADLSSALHAAGQAGLVHRDVKPENILLDDTTGRALLADFGIARALADVDGVRTAQGVAVGTPTYMSPEQAAGDHVDARSDLYALGVVAYEMLAGRPPFRAPNAAAVASMHLGEKPAPVESLRKDLPPAVAAAVNRALEKDPARRWQTGAEFRSAILGLSPVPAAGGRRRRGAALVALGVVVALVAGAVLALRPAGPPAGVNPRHSLLVLPFENVRQNPAVEWLRDGSVSMLTLNLSQWIDLSVVDHERLHDLLVRRKLTSDAPVGLDMARRLARDAGAWTVVLGNFTQVGDSLELVARVYDVASGERVDVAQVTGKPGEDVRPLFDQLAARLLDLSGAPTGLTAELALVTTPSLTAYRSYLEGMEQLSAWNLLSAERLFRRAVETDTTFGLAHYKLSLTRGWIGGDRDSLGLESIRRAAEFSARLPVHDRAMINAYRLFLERDFVRSEASYRALLQNDSTDADAWYGLGDVTFHNPEMKTRDALWTTSLRAFKRAITLDPDYYLAYEHLAQLYLWAADDPPMLALLPNDSLIHLMPGTARPDSAAVALAQRRARTEGIASARNWVTQQPDNVHAQNALVFALSTAEQHDAALAEIDRLTRRPRASGRADLPFLRARVLTAAGRYAEAVRVVAGALDSARAGDFDFERLPAAVTVGEVLHGANLLAMAGRVELAGQALGLAADLNQRFSPQLPGSQPAGDRTLYRRLLEGHLATALGAPRTRLTDTWEAVADAARRAPAARRGLVATFGWPAVLGLFLQDREEAETLREFETLTHSPPPPEVEALIALQKGDSATARRLLTAPPDSAGGGKDLELALQSRPQWFAYRAMLQAQLWYELGDNQQALKALDFFEPGQLSAEGMDLRWYLLGQARMLRGQVYERLGQKAEARQAYQAALAQWSGADEALAPLVTRLRSRLGEVGG